MQSDQRDTDLLLVREVAREIHAHESTVRRAIAAGELNAVTLGPGGHYRIRRTDLEQFLQEVEPRVLGTATVGRTEKRP